MSYENDTLTCQLHNLDTFGTVVWKKDHQYFANPHPHNTLHLTAELYKYLTADNSVG